MNEVLNMKPELE